MFIMFQAMLKKKKKKNSRVVFLGVSFLHCGNRTKGYGIVSFRIYYFQLNIK